MEPAATSVHRLGLKGDPLNLNVADSVDVNPDAAEDWQFSTKGKKLADVGHGQVPVGGEDAELAAVSFRDVVQQATVSFAALRRIRPEAGAAEARALLVSLGLVAHVAAFGRSFSLRSGAELRPIGATWTWLGETGSTADRAAGPGSGDRAVPGVRRQGGACRAAGRPSMVRIAAGPDARGEPCRGDPQDLAGQLMLAITLTLLHGTFHGGSPDDTASAGGQARGEWPPSPARLFCALVAAEGTRDRCQLTTGEELGWLERLLPPDIYASPPEDVLVSRLQDRYVVVDATEDGAVQDYPARQARLVRRGVRQSPRDAKITYVWPEASPSPGQLAALRVRAARVGYLGCADTPAMLAVSDRLPDDLGGHWRVERSSPMTLPVPYPGFLQALDASYDAWVGGVKTRRSWIRTERAGYLPPGAAAARPPQERPFADLVAVRPGRGRRQAARGHRHAAAGRARSRAAAAPGRRGP